MINPKQINSKRFTLTKWKKSHLIINHFEEFRIAWNFALRYSSNYFQKQIGNKNDQKILHV